MQTPATAKLENRPFGSRLHGQCERRRTASKPLRFIDTDQFLASSSVLAKTVVRDSIKPRGKPRFAAKAADVLVSTKKSLLCKIVGQSNVGAGELPQQTA